VVQNGPFTVRWRSGWISPTVQLAITFAVSPCELAAGHLQVIQVFWATRRFNGQQVGNVLLHKDGVDYDACVDAGIFSPAVTLQGQLAAHQTKPYFYSADRLTDEAYGCYIRLSDRPDAVRLHGISEFETAIMFTDFEGTGADRVLASYRWGYTCAALGQDPEYSHVPLGGAEIDFPDEGAATSAEFKAIVGHDYPDYRFDEFR